MNIKEYFIKNNKEVKFKMFFLKRKLTEETIYYTNDEGFKSFKVVANMHSTIIYKESILQSNKYDRFVQKYTPFEIHVGNSNMNVLCENSEDIICEGNSILLKVKNDKRKNINCASIKYVFIGHNVYEFELEEDDMFEAFYSLVDDNVSYPLLLGKKNIYFLLDYVYIPRAHFPKNINLEDSYNYYYESGNLGLYDYEMPIRNKKFIAHPPYD